MNFVKVLMNFLKRIFRCLKRFVRNEASHRPQNNFIQMHEQYLEICHGDSSTFIHRDIIHILQNDVLIQNIMRKYTPDALNTMLYNQKITQAIVKYAFHLKLYQSTCNLTNKIKTLNEKLNNMSKQSRMKDLEFKNKLCETEARFKHELEKSEHNFKFEVAEVKNTISNFRSFTSLQRTQNSITLGN